MAEGEPHPESGPGSNSEASRIDSPPTPPAPEVVVVSEDAAQTEAAIEQVKTRLSSNAPAEKPGAQVSEALDAVGDHIGGSHDGPAMKAFKFVKGWGGLFFALMWQAIKRAPEMAGKGGGGHGGGAAKKPAGGGGHH